MARILRLSFLPPKVYNIIAGSGNEIELPTHSLCPPEVTLTSDQKPFSILTSIYARSDKGNVRENNEDNFIIADIATGRACSAPQSIDRQLEQNRLLLAVSDGMGGAQAGEIASAIAVYGLRAELTRLKDARDPVERLTRAVERVNALILEKSAESPLLRGMGATLTAAFVDGGRVYLAEVGDSRAYIIRHGRIRQVTIDQSLYAMLSETGEYKRGEKVPTPTSKNVLLQSLGGQESVQVALSCVELRAGDHLLLCSDGLSNKLSADEIRKFVNRSPNLEAACRTMVDVAKKRGGEDNITVVLARFDGNGLQRGVHTPLQQTIDVLALFDPMSNEPDRSTRQLFSDESDEEQEPFSSTIGILPDPHYGGKARVVSTSEKVVQLLNDTRKSYHELVVELKSLEAWLQEQGGYDPELRRTLAHLEHSNRKLHRMEVAARRYRALIERLVN